MKKVNKMILFTASACPMGRTMGTVLREVEERCPDVSMMTFFIDLHVQETNHYRIKQNPTTLFLSHDNQELGRVEGFQETDDLISMMKRLSSNQVSETVDREENRETIEKYVIYLYQEDLLVPVEVEYTNLTSVITPRITLIQQLIHAKVDGLENPFPLSTVLELVQFKENKGVITLKWEGLLGDQELSKMKMALEKSLETFGIDDVEIKCKS